MTDLTNLTDSQIRQIREKYRGNWSFLGDPDAEHDTHRQGWLDDLFIKAPEFSQAIEGKASLVIGRKGSGKSALRIAASERSRANVGPKRRLEITASADDLMAAHAPIIQALGGQASTQEGTVQTWQRTFIYLILRSLAQELSGQATTSRTDEAIRKWALEKSVVGLDWGEWLIETAKKSIPRVAKALGRLPSNPLTEEAVMQAISTTGFVISVDDFDNLYSSEHKLAGIRAVQAAIEAADRMSRRRDFSYITLYLREDLWSLIGQDWHYLDKVSSHLLLQWNQEQLKAWIERRLRRPVADALGHKPSEIRVPFEALWSCFFPPTITLDTGQISSGFLHLLRKTMYTPRDLQRLLKTAAEITGSWPVQPDSIPKAEERYASELIQFLSNEYGPLCQGLIVCLNSFTGKPLEWIANKLFKHLRSLIDSGQVTLAPGASLGQTDEVALARFLFRIGFLEVRIPETDRYEVRDGVRFPEFWRGIRRDDAVKWAVRSAFYKYLRSHTDKSRFLE